MFRREFVARKVGNVLRKCWRAKYKSQDTTLLSRNIHRSVISSEEHDKERYDTFQLSQYPVPNIKELPIQVQELMHETEDKAGFIPNVMLAYSHRPAEFKAFFEYYDVLMKKETGNLTKADREMIVVATSAHNNCLYCVVSHSAFHRIYSKNPIVADQLATNWKCANINDREKAILSLAMAVCKCEEVKPEHFTNLEEHGLDGEDAWDIAAISAFFSMSNRMAHFTNMRPNEEFYNMGRVPKKKE